MRLLYLSYWSVGEGLTQATILPHLGVLQGSPRIEKLLFVTVERGPSQAPPPALDARHVGLRARSMRPSLAARMLDFLELPSQIARLCREEGTDFVLARGSAAGALAHLMQRHLPLPYSVESFEPHAAYMRESGVWRRWDPRYVFQRRWEEAQKRGAAALLPVAESYRQLLIGEGLSPERIVTLPCTVDTERFRFDPEARQQLRTQMGVAATEVLGLYLGKFGGIYQDAEAFRVFARFAQRLSPFRMLVLTPVPAATVRALASASGFPLDRLFVTEVPHAEVPRHLSAADVGFATIRPAPSRRYCSPVKVGEYWAAGLPIVITQGIGDDSDIVSRHDAGAVISSEERSLHDAADHIRQLLDDPGHRARIAGLAARFRSRARVRDAYTKLGWLP
jgi:glycosyltransferase involved in cell wall biosynthesis